MKSLAAKKSLNWWNPSTLLLIFSNLVAIWLAYVDKLHFLDVLLICFFQGLIIFYFSYKRIFLYDKIVLSKSGEVLSAPHEKRRIANSFLYVSGILYASVGFTLLFLILHLVFNQLQGKESVETYLNYSAVVISAFVFLVNHAFSFLYHRENDKQMQQSTHSIFLLPVIRMAPFLLFPILGIFLAVTVESAVVLAFMSIKAFFDVYVHQLMHSETV